MNKKHKGFVVFALISTLAAIFPSIAGAHASGENYIFLEEWEGSTVSGKFTFHKDDITEKLGIDLSAGENEETIALMKSSAPQVHDYIRERFSMGSNGKSVEFEFLDMEFAPMAPGYLNYKFRAAFDEVPTVIDFTHSMLYEGDILHRGMICISYNPIRDESYPGETIALIFNRNEEVQSLDLQEPIKNLLTPRQFVWQGILHIWIGIDHILFLVVLLLPAVLIRKDNKWEPSPNFFKASFRILKIVTVFTIAHSITLALASLGYVSVSSRFVESMIAASIVLVALNNIYPRFKEGSTLIIFAFGLFHGLGFATVMGDIPFRMGNLVKVLIGFNVGVEIGQVAIVLLAFAVLYAVNSFKFYVPVILRVGSAAAAVVAAFWFVERAVGI